MARRTDVAAGGGAERGGVVVVLLLKTDTALSSEVRAELGAPPTSALASALARRHQTEVLVAVQ